MAQPQLTAEEDRVEEEDDVDIDGATTPLVHGKFWEAAHPNSPLTTPLTQMPRSPSQTEEVHGGSEERILLFRPYLKKMLLMKILSMP